MVLQQDLSFKRFFGVHVLISEGSTSTLPLKQMESPEFFHAFLTSKVHTQTSPVAGKRRLFPKVDPHLWHELPQMSLRFNSGKLKKWSTHESSQLQNKMHTQHHRNFFTTFLPILAPGLPLKKEPSTTYPRNPGFCKALMAVFVIFKVGLTMGWISTEAEKLIFEFQVQFCDVQFETNQIR